MLPRADITSVRPVAYLEAPTPVGSSTDARQEVFHQLTNITLGQQLDAKVLSKLDDGTFLVRINDTSARMSLPVGTRVGDSLPMTLIDTEPRMTFLLGSEAGVEADSAKATLSSAGRLIDNLLQTAEQHGTSTAIIGKTPVVATPTAAAPEIAAALQDTLTSSGLFYESHLQQWLDGSRSLADLMREPQNKGDINAKSQPATTQAETTRLLNFVRELSNNGRPVAELIRDVQTQLAGDKDSMRLLNVVRDWTESGRSLADLTQTLKTQSGAETLLRSDTVTPDAARLINQQLNTLENQHVMWRGELWPGQQMEWEVSRDAPKNKQTEEAQQSWQSVVRFDLPTLGTVSATINLTGDRVYMQIRTTTEEAASSLRSHGNELIDAMQTAGTPLDSLTVKQDAEN
ncbi:MAG: flagellar hook-length control protein FliK [Burkholderiaceae bacterium]